ncbi:MAG: hypothetical protein JO142_11235 [Burkholderiales bacterium]|nr:hypothetical protein [Burkholderiales bacterium]
MAFVHRLRQLTLALLVGTISASAWAGELVKVASRDGVTVDYWLQTQEGNSPAVIAVLFVGGAGTLHLTEHVSGNSATFQRGANFLVRIEDALASAPIATALVDAPSDRQSGMDDTFRMGEQHAQDVGAVLDDLHARFPTAKRVLIGTSRGTISAAYLASRLGSRIDGVVLTSLVTNASKRGGPGLSSFDYSKLATPVLLVQHHDDNCPVCPYNAVAKLESRFPLITVHGGKPAETDECEPLSHHGYYGRESEVAAALRAWMLHEPYPKDIE